MAQFTIRVELHDADSEDYENLHEEMENEGFERTIIGKDGIEYKLPTAEYNYLGNTTRDNILDKAKSAAKRTGKDFCVLVAESAGRTWYGLKRVN